MTLPVSSYQFTDTDTARQITPIEPYLYLSYSILQQIILFLYKIKNMSTILYILLGIFEIHE